LVALAAPSQATGEKWYTVTKVTPNYVIVEDEYSNEETFSIEEFETTFIVH
jgi:hypothetical protein